MPSEMLEPIPMNAKGVLAFSVYSAYFEVANGQPHKLQTW